MNHDRQARRDGLCADCGAAPATLGRFCEPCATRGLPTERDPAEVRRELRVRRAACATLLWGIRLAQDGRDAEAGRAAVVEAAAAEGALDELAAAMVVVIRCHLGNVPAALVHFEAALAAEEYQHAAFVDGSAAAAEAHANRIILLCHKTIHDVARDLLVEGLEGELRAYSLVSDEPADDLDEGGAL
ncbi:hypothetical protein A5642_22070 [Mycolicibacterium mucogenicum]|uniref:Uncharacterized protein n=1 Tax=Mycolicibacterium mucogenicum TaxID=56689 RepID=A0A1A0MMY5_MYCMU|nr:hypothetical protein [Mycolicibacterium mucogenicum]OBA86767.1 hypothetical protein A5642_22070 [Mycolicibacterium mucogenicum]